ncbi:MULTISPECIES: GNAT family N-acetyltransferase [Brevibacillus]|jgi:Acetyltransferases|uniref:GNAT family N-acetyltransferase n=1 Tax=Brevibacillus TaxID=55080 RepID=UPI00156AF2C8|nr:MULTISPECIES: GNAT family N-acetyltransferase [Brevibacillus]MBU8712272.1 GNAT family N-acetyltransferase [Brevibacillus parabrevis]MDH6349343.1 ribosomal protein S18 acetylase RimI-like enzyme [Brevibacillus sp. 1238]MDR5001355.1 GNAT family N-acetyltransferase [Brevibacillus parabrevis]MED2257388.1 GNAT family N-acetyltransferase [Brevibacillus parabrevis]NRQ52369.1 GNAT family N-acetyltransferase [Brevibacillus sp. HD1.4A]
MYRKELYVFEGDKPRKAVIRNYNRSDFFELIQIQAESFPPPFPSELWWNQEQLTNHITLFPEGAICVEVDGVLAGSMTALLVSFDPAHPEHKWADVTDDGYIRSHNPGGDTLYIVDICIRPSHRKLGLGQLMMQAMYELVVQKGLTRLLGGGRMPGYGRYANQWTPEQYVEHVVSGEVKDPVITFLMRCGRVPVQIVADYLEDEESRNYAVLMEWKNPFLAR